MLSSSKIQFIPDDGSGSLEHEIDPKDIADIIEFIKLKDEQTRMRK